MTVQQCKYVIEIHRMGSFGKAARELFVAQSSLSASIKQLEDELGIRIFERSKKGTVLTPEGAEFARYAAELVSKNDFIEERYKKQENGARLYVSTQHYDFIADAFCRLVTERAEERYSLSLQEKETYEVIRDVEIAYSDVGIIAIKAESFDIMKRYLQNKGLSFTPILRVAPHVFLRKGHPLAGEKQLKFEMLSSYPYLSYDQGTHTDSWFTEEMILGHLTERQIVISDRATLMNLLLTTDAYTVGTGIMPSALKRGEIVSCPIESDSHYSVGYIMRTDRRETAIVKDFLSAIRRFGGEDL